MEFAQKRNFQFGTNVGKGDIVGSERKLTECEQEQCDAAIGF